MTIDRVPEPASGSVPERATLADALGLPALRRADPVVLTGADRLDRPLRWVHTTELTDVGDLLRPGDLVLTMGTGLPSEDDAAALDRYVATLAEVGSAGVVLELGRRWTSAVPAPVVAAFAARGVPLIALQHETQFAAIAQEVGERIVDAQLAELRDAQRVHETFTELSFTQAGPAEILDAVQRLSGGAVVLENAQHRPVDYLAGPGDAAGFLDGWATRSARVSIAGRSGWHAGHSWLVTRLGPSDQDGGRLVITCPGPPSQRLVAVAERAAAALALHRLHDRDRDNLVRRTHRALMDELQTGPDAGELQRRCELAGFPVRHRQFLGLVLRPRGVPLGTADGHEVAAAAVRAAHTAKVPALVCEVDRETRVLLSFSPGVAPDAIADRVAQRVLAQHDVVAAAGRVAADRSGIRRTLLEAAHVADAVPASTAAPSLHRLEDLHLRGLLSMLGEDDRLALFVERELAPLRHHDGPADLYAALRALLTHPTSKTDAAASLHLSRAAFYDRLAKVEQLLGVRLDDPDVRVSLHVALVADELAAQRQA